jgi:hypothetical protein
VPEQRGGNPEIFAQHLGRRVLEPVAQQEGRVLVKTAAVEHQQEFAAVGPEALDRMRNAAGKIPEIADADVVDEIAALRIDRGDARGAVKHVRPFGFLVPMQFAHAAGIEAHVDAGDVLGDAKLALGDLARPAAAFLAHMRVGKRKAQIGQRAMIGGWRVEDVGILAVAQKVARTGIGAANARSAARLGNLVRALGFGGGGCCDARNACGKHTAARDVVHAAPLLCAIGNDG